MPRYESTKRRLTWPNGMFAVAYSGDEPGQLRGPQHGSAWVDELAKFKHPQETWDNLEFGLRLGSSPQTVVTTTPRPIPILRELIDDPDTIETRGSSYENLHNLSARFIKRVIRKYEGTRLGRQEIHAELLEDVPGALCVRDDIEKARVTKHPDLVRIVVGVDPHASTGETGIVAAGIDADDHGYVLDDLTTGGSPATWAGQVVTCYNNHHADRVIGESNNGGDMVEHTIRMMEGGKTVSYKKIWASRGKHTRAEPVAALYEQGKVHHVGMFADLEDKLCSWVPGEGGDSPNRMDALVWALTELMLGDADSSWDDLEGLGSVEDYESRWA